MATQNFLLVFVGQQGKNRALDKKDRPVHSELIPGSLNVLACPLVEHSKIVFPPLHIKLGIIKQFVKALKKDGDNFIYICIKFPCLTIQKLKVGIFDGLMFRK